MMNQKNVEGSVYELFYAITQEFYERDWEKP
jgi:hypothetical protein